MQRALALGVAMYALQASGGGENAYWIMLALWTALQPRSRATVRNAVQRSAGALIGAGLAIVVSLILPDAILYPAVAVILLLILPTRPRPAYRLRRAREALDAAVDCLLTRTPPAGSTSRAPGKRPPASCPAWRTWTMSGTSSRRTKADYDRRVVVFRQAHDDVRMLALLVARDPAAEIVPSALGSIKQEYAGAPI
ncbi:MAG: FUSC family protein [Frankiaceae bacterium]